LSREHLYLPDIEEYTAIELCEKFFRGRIGEFSRNTSMVEQVWIYEAAEISYHYAFFDLIREYVDIFKGTMNRDANIEIWGKCLNFISDNNIIKLDNNDENILRLLRLQVLI